MAEIARLELATDRLTADCTTIVLYLISTEDINRELRQRFHLVDLHPLRNY